ncbi:MAG: hypothetical protein AB7L66_22610 [Gemmatimonadales bacterium]
MSRQRSLRAFAAALALGLSAAVTTPAWAGDLADVRVVQAKDPVNGVRMIEVSGMVAGGQKQTVWVMISERNYAKLVGCKRAADGSGAALQYSDKSQMVNVIVCDH